MKYHAQPNQSNNQPGASRDTQIKQCHDCLAQLPINCFGASKLSKGGYSHICSYCRAQYLRHRRKIKYNTKSKVSDEIIRSVRVQNQNLIQQCIFKSESVHIVGFIPSTQATFHIQFGRNRYDLESMAVYDDKGNSYFEVVYSGVDPDKVISQLLANLKEHNIRLERSEGDIVLAKRVVYYIGS